MMRLYKSIGNKYKDKYAEKGRIFAVQNFIYLLVPWFTFLKTNVALKIQHSD